MLISLDLVGIIGWSVKEKTPDGLLVDIFYEMIVCHDDDGI